MCRISAPTLHHPLGKVYNVINWDRFRHLLVSYSASQTALDVIPECLKAATTVLLLLVPYPSPDLKFRALRAASRRLQRRARRSGVLSSAVLSRSAVEQ